MDPLKLGVVLLDSGTAQENADQVTTLNALLTPVTTVPPVYTFATLGTSNIVSVYHMVPFGKTSPTNRDLINGEGVVYGSNSPVPDTLTTGPRRVAEIMADIILYITDISRFNVLQLGGLITALIASDRRKVTVWGYIVTKQDVLDRR